MAAGEHKEKEGSSSTGTGAGIANTGTGKERAGSSSSSVSRDEAFAARLSDPNVGELQCWLLFSLDL